MSPWLTPASWPSRTTCRPSKEARVGQVQHDKVGAVPGFDQANGLAQHRAAVTGCQPDQRVRGHLGDAADLDALR